MGRVKLATEQDIPRIVEMGERFFEVSPYSKLAKYNHQQIEKLLRQMIDLGTLVTDGESGMLGFFIFPVFMDPDTIIAQEMFWWVDENRRGGTLSLKLLKFAEKIAKESGATAFNMLCLTDLDGGRVGRLYKSQGYKPTENTYMRLL